MKYTLIIFILLFTSIIESSCNKTFLDIKPDKELVVPSTLDDLQGLLDYSDVMNSYTPSLGEVSADDYYVTDEKWNSLTTPDEKNAYIWTKNIFDGVTSIDWNDSYQVIFYANNALEGLAKINRASDSTLYDQIKGRALFYRAFAFFRLAQIFSPPFDKSGTNEEYSIPLRLISNLNIAVKRSTVKKVYNQITSDLLTAANLLPIHDSYKTRPVKAAAYALLARTYLTMQDYDEALQYSERVINYSYQLLDFNTLDVSASYPMTRYNSEVIFQSKFYVPILGSSRLIVDSTLYSFYSDDDIRKDAWFKYVSGNYTFKGSYDGSIQYFSGLAIDECYLTKAECLDREGKIEDAINTLNQFLMSRYKTGTYTPYGTTDPKAALKIILEERRKELLFRGVRWNDLRRLNLNPVTAKTLYRVLKGTTYKLMPNSLNYTLPIPDDVIQMSGIQQNERE